MKAFMVASPVTGSGKTTVTLALMAALRRRGFTVQSFKCGPDFIDPAHHACVTGRGSRNLDSWMLDAEANRTIFNHASEGADVVVVQAMMGLFDGVAGASEHSSSAEIAKQLNIAIVLVVDVSTAARSIADVIHGFESFDPNLKVVGVVLNKVGGEGHLRLLQEAIQGSCRSAVLGSLPHAAALHIPERHLGLVTAAEQPLSSEQISLLADLAERHINLNALIGACESSEPALGGATRVIPTTAGTPAKTYRDGSIVRMGGVLPLAIEMSRGPVNFGYTEVVFDDECLLGESGRVARGHSFHYSKIAESGELDHVYRVSYTLSGRSELEGFAKNNVLASYIHLHFKSNPALATSLVAHAYAAREAVIAQS